MSTVQMLLFLALLVQVALTLVQYVRLLQSRLRAVKDGTANLHVVGYDQSGWPEKSRLICNSVTSQFELPVLFYVAVVLTYVLGALSWIAVILAWLFVIARVIHAVIHTGSNTVPARLRVFFFSFVVVIVYWLYLTWHVISGWLLLA